MDKIKEIIHVNIFTKFLFFLSLYLTPIFLLFLFNFVWRNLIGSSYSLVPDSCRIFRSYSFFCEWSAAIIIYYIPSFYALFKFSKNDVTKNFHTLFLLLSAPVYAVGLLFLACLMGNCI